MPSDNANRPAAELTKREFIAALLTHGLLSRSDMTGTAKAFSELAVQTTDALFESLEAPQGKKVP